MVGSGVMGLLYRSTLLGSQLVASLGAPALVHGGKTASMHIVIPNPRFVFLLEQHRGMTVRYT